MKIIVTGSLGNISKPLTKILVEQGHAGWAAGLLLQHPKMGKVKLADFAKEFASVYKQNK